MTARLVLISLILALLPSTILAQDSKPKIPFIQSGICPFECCQYGTWTTESPLIAYKKEFGDTAIAFRMKPGESFTASNGNVYIVKPGYVVLNKSFDKFIKGDTVYLLSYRGEGAYDLWYKGELLDFLDLNKMDVFWSNTTFKESPLFVWCVLVERSDGKQGWIRLKNSPKSDWWKEKIKGMDSCS